MQSTLKLRESDPHDVFTVAQEIVSAAWADKVIADIARDAKSQLSESPPPQTQPSQTVASDPPPAASGASADAAAPMVDTTFRATAVSDLHVANDRPADLPPGRSWVKSPAWVVMFALCSAAATVGWQHYGDTAKQMISHWTPAFALASSPPPERTALAAQPDTPAVQAAAADPAPVQNAAPAATVAAADTAQVQAMARDLAAIGQQVEQLKAGIAELKASQQAMARDAAKPSELKPSEMKPSELKPSGIKPAEVGTSLPSPRPKLSAAPPRPAVAPARRPMPAYAPVQAAAPTQLAPVLPRQLPPPAQAAPQLDDDEPVIRPPMPLH